MQIGVVFPQYEFNGDPSAIRDFAQMVEEMGYTHVLAYEHVMGANPERPGGWEGPYTYENKFYEPFSLFSFMAAVTERLGFITGILILPQRPTALVANQAATLDALSNGRFRLGVGSGWSEVEYIALNEDFHNRGKRMDEQITLLRRLFSEELVEFEGDFHTIPDAGLNPRPVQGRLPIWIGGYVEKVLRRVGTMGDGWLPGGSFSDTVKLNIDKIRNYAEEAGRDADAIGLEPWIQYGEGNPDEWKTAMENWRSVSATHITINTLHAGFSKPQEHMDALKKFADEMGV